MDNLPRPASPAFAERRIPRDRGAVYVRDFPGDGPAFVLLHGFPDNSHIYDDLIPHLAASGRRIIALDFLGFGASDKPEGAHYSFTQQLGDLEAVAETLGLDKIIAGGHDAGGPAAVNFALKHPERTAAVCLMNAFYGDAPGLRVPEFIELFSNKSLKALAQHFLASPQQFAWLLGFQRDQMQAGLNEAQRARYADFLGPIIDQNFRQRPGAGAAFAQMTYQLSDEVAANTARIVEFRRSDIPLLLIWGRLDPYLHISVADYMRSQHKTSVLHVLDAGHWPQIDAAADVARIMLTSYQAALGEKMNS
jgi:pimeloyl-ACP methyl ester carboxylesterase